MERFKLKYGYGTDITCPKCGNGNRSYKYHKRCSTLSLEHLHVKCWRCSFEFGAEPKDANV